MQDKRVLGQFAAKISKAKILYDSTSATCQKLRREANQLQKQYQALCNQRESAEIMEKSLKKQLDMTEKANSEQQDRCRKEEQQLAELKENKKNLKREKDLEHNLLQKNTLELEELVSRREQLESIAKSLSEKLEGVSSEKQVLQQEYAKTDAAVKSYNDKIKELEKQIHQMREVITVNTVPVHNMNDSHAAAQ